MSSPDNDHHRPEGPDGEEQRRRLLALLGTAEPGTGGDAPVEDRDRARLNRVCALSVSEAGVSGAGITVMASVEAGLVGERDQVCATGARTRRLEDLQLTTGEGPCLDAFSSGAPVLVAVLEAATVRWPGYGPEALGGGTAAVFSLPLQVGAVRLGTLDLNRDTGGPLSPAELGDAVVLAGLATETLLELAGDPEPPSTTAVDVGGDSSVRPREHGGWLSDVHAHVHQASGMVSARADIGVGDALLRIRAYAFAQGDPISDVARRIVDRELVLDGDDP